MCRLPDNVITAGLIATLAALAVADHDPHTTHEAHEPKMTHVDLDLRPDFNTKTIAGIACITFDKPGLTHLDTKDLDIKDVRNPANARRPDCLLHESNPDEPFMGRKLEVVVPESCQITILYKTSPNASGLQWLPPEQTTGGKHPFLFTQAQSIHARSFMPCQDTPAVRFTYSMALHVPAKLRGLAAATPLDRTEGRRDRQRIAIERYKMEHAIPSYLVAFAVGDLESRELSDRSRVWADPSVVDAAAREFRKTERVMTIAEGIMGPYLWGRFDMLVLPFSFPYGGMEHPGLTFISQTVINGDESGMQVVAHELAHHWLGNFVTNASWEHFWLNEGPTVWFENLIMRHAFGDAEADRNQALAYLSMLDNFDTFRQRNQPEMTHLRLHLKGVDPDDSFSGVPYQMGCRFLQTLEAMVDAEYDAETFLEFMRAYVQYFAWKSVTTEQFCAFFEAYFPGILERCNVNAWLHEPWMPSTYVVPASPQVDVPQQMATDRMLPSTEEVTYWHPYQLALYLGKIPSANPDDPQGNADTAQLMADLHSHYNLIEHYHLEVRWAWLILQARANWHCDDPQFREAAHKLLHDVGRMKHLKGLYKALNENPHTRAWAHSTFAELKPRYNPIAVYVVGKILEDQAA